MKDGQGIQAALRQAEIMTSKRRHRAYNDMHFFFFFQKGFVLLLFHIVQAGMRIWKTPVFHPAPRRPRTRALRCDQLLVRNLHKVRVAGKELHAGCVVGPDGRRGVVTTLQFKLVEDAAAGVVEVVGGLEGREGGRGRRGEVSGGE